MPRVNFFTKLTGVEEAIEILLGSIAPITRKYAVELDYADNRILASDITAPRDQPHYDQCFMDGYAVIAEDTAGSSEKSPMFLRLTDGPVTRGTCLQVHTGSALPEGADAVVRLEEMEAAEGGIKVLQEASRGQYFTPKGKVMKRGDMVFLEGRQLKPTDIAMLATMGLTEVEVYEKPRVLVVPTGDEVVERGKVAGPGHVNESNGLMCYLYVRRFGGKASVWDLVPDDVEKLRDALTAGLKYDLIVTSGGTSVGKRDHMREIVEAMGQVLVHGIKLKPGRPSGIGYIEENGRRVPIVFLPGFPDACAVGAMMLVAKAVEKLGHYPERRYPEVETELLDSVTTFPGTVAVKKVAVKDGKATLVETVGPSPREGEYAYVMIPEDGKGLDKGDRACLRFLE